MSGPFGPYSRWHFRNHRLLIDHNAESREEGEKALLAGNQQ